MYCFSVPHEAAVHVGCYLNGKTENNVEFDGEELLYVDFERDEIVSTIPTFLDVDPSSFFDPARTLVNAKKHKLACAAIMSYLALEEKNPPQEQGKGLTVYCISQYNGDKGDMID